MGKRITESIVKDFNSASFRLLASGVSPVAGLVLICHVVFASADHAVLLCISLHPCR